MSRSDHSRRAVLKSAGLGVGAGLLSDLAPAVAAENAEIWAHEYWANKDDVKLNLWRKRIGAPAPGEQARPVAVSRARFLEFVALFIRSECAGQRRIFADECVRPLRLRRLDHGP